MAKEYPEDATSAAVIGCGPVGLMAILAAQAQGAQKARQLTYACLPACLPVILSECLFVWHRFVNMTCRTVCYYVALHVARLGLGLATWVQLLCMHDVNLVQCFGDIADLSAQLRKCFVTHKVQ